jgi:hypothetical protein
MGALKVPPCRGNLADCPRCSIFSPFEKISGAHGVFGFA